MKKVCLIVTDLADVLRVQLECGKCHAQVLYDPDGSTDIPTKCPQCLGEWKDLQFPGADQQIIEGFFQALKRARDQQREPNRIKIGLVFAGDMQ